MMFTNIDEAIDWICTKKEKKFPFEDFKEICHNNGDKQDGFYTIHVAGTNGKGSFVSYLCDLLMSHGYKVGTFTSPHYVTHLDRIRVNKNNIPADKFLEIFNSYSDLFAEKKLTMMQMDFMIMCDYFHEEEVDFAIIETGIGGRFDATNVLKDTALSVITTIGYDHMELLGDTLEEICFEKCGIIKDDSKVLIGKLEESCVEVVKTQCELHNSELFILDDFIRTGDRSFIYHDKEYELSTYADYQLHNASLAIQALEIIAHDYPFVIDYEQARKAVYYSIWHCRFEMVKENPRVILDGAHNIHGVEALVKSFDQFSGSKCIVFSALKRKEYKKMINVLKNHCDELYITCFENKEVIDLKEFGDFITFSDYRQAIEEAINNYDNILICGSLYFMSDVVLNCKFN
ncbi:MAG: hypothetical protein IJI66_12910 [Erysipelotrichaceae bacterium]|nr:hypothetical protein [Erysipelotrichaceae bacterium]